MANNFPNMIAALQTLPGGLPDVHIGVVSSNMELAMAPWAATAANGLGDRGLLWATIPPT